MFILEIRGEIVEFRKEVCTFNIHHRVSGWVPVVEIACDIDGIVHIPLVYEADAASLYTGEASEARRSDELFSESLAVISGSGLDLAEQVWKR